MTPRHANRSKTVISSWLRLSMWIVMGMLCLLTIYSAYGGYIQPSLSFVGKTAPLAVMAFPALVIIVVVLGVILGLCRSKSAYIAVATLCICAPSIWNICPVNLIKDPVLEQHEYKAFKLLTFNVMNMWDYEESHSHDADNRILSFIIHTDADIVSLQEIIYFPKVEQNSNVTAQIDTIHQMYPYISKATDGALMVLSKYPIKRINIPKPFVNKYLPYAAYSIDLPQGPITLFDCHMESIGLTDSDKASYQDITRGKAGKADIKDMKNSALHKLNEAYRSRSIQVNQLREVADSIGGNIIIAGDFNDVPLSYSIRCLQEAGFKEVYPSLALGPGFTYHADRLYFRIDHMLYRGTLKPLSLEIPKVNLSDHYPMIATFLE